MKALKYDKEVNVIWKDKKFNIQKLNLPSVAFGPCASLP